MSANAIDIDSNHALGKASDELVQASMAERSGTGAVCAYRDGDVWRPLDASRADDYRRMGHEVRTVYVEERS